MPIYEYHCNQCGQDFEFMQKMSDAAITLCPKCDVNSLEKRVSAAAFHLKGSGWYQTDFKNDKKPETKPAADSAASETKTVPNDNKKKESS